ncbi:MAG: hypothetical protein HY820_27595 [Acidobacteria bacterium]|nr:hypothetical protein [Acidobacteriota bacterium]
MTANRMSTYVFCGGVFFTSALACLVAIRKPMSGVQQLAVPLLLLSNAMLLFDELSRENRVRKLISEVRDISLSDGERDLRAQRLMFAAMETPSPLAMIVIWLVMLQF